MKKQLEASIMQRRLAANRLDKVLGKTECVKTENPPTHKVVKAAGPKTARRFVTSNA